MCHVTPHAAELCDAWRNDTLHDTAQVLLGTKPQVQIRADPCTLPHCRYNLKHALELFTYIYTHLCAFSSMSPGCCHGQLQYCLFLHVLPCPLRKLELCLFS